MILLTFPIHFFFISIFAAFAKQTKFIFSCDGITLLNHDGFERNWIYCSSRFRKIAVGIKKYFLPKMRFHASFSNQLSRLSRFLKVLENRIRQYFITYNPKTWFILTRSKQNWPLKWKKTSLDGFGLPTRSCLFCFHMMTFSWQKGVGKNTSRSSYVTKSAAPKLIKKSLLESSIQFLITKL